MIRSILEIWRPAVTVGIILLIWSSVCAFGIISPIVLPTPIEVLLDGAEVLSTWRDLESIWFTFWRVFEGTAILLLVGAPLGIVLSYYPSALRYVSGPIDFLRSIPPAIMVPLFFFASPDAGADNDFARVGLLCFGCFPILLMQVTETARNLPRERIEFARSINASAWFIVSKIVIYEILPNLFIAVRTALSFGIVVIIVTELIYPPLLGIGARVLDAQADYGVGYTYVYALLAGLVGMCLNRLCIALERRLLFWKRGIEQ
jgi:ABC-type nitrate/sulfonate/bicarbonate transport system permease component